MFNNFEDKGKPSGREPLNVDNYEKKEKHPGSVAGMIKPLVLVRPILGVCYLPFFKTLYILNVLSIM